MPAMRAIAASQTSVSENCGLTSVLHPIAAVRVVGFRQAARDPLPTVGSDTIDRKCDFQSGRFELASASTAPEYFYCDRTMLR